MRILTSSLICAALLCAVVSLRADDNTAQAAARAALMQKMQELDSTQSDNSAPPPPASENTPERPSAPVEPPAPENQPPPVPTPSIPPSQPVVAPAPEVVVPQTPPAAVVPAASASSGEMSPQAEEQAIISGRQGAVQPQATSAPANALPVMNEMASPPAQTPVPVQPQKKRGFFSHILHPFGHASHPAVVEVQHPQPTQGYAVKNNSNFAPITPPPAPVSPDQEAQLQALLEKYKADQITPDEYQAQRAIIVGPR